MFLLRRSRGVCAFRHNVTFSFRRLSSAQAEATEFGSVWRPLAAPVDLFNAERIAMNKKRKLILKKRKELFRNTHASEGTNEEVLSFEVRALLDQVERSNPKSTSSNSNKIIKTDGAVSEEQEKGNHRNASPDLVEPEEIGKEVELDIVQLSSTGDGLAYNADKDHIIVVPFSIPGDRVLAKVYQWQVFYSLADFIKVITPSPKREGITPQCKYFTECSGCQFQMISYEDQLKHKKQIIERAYQHFSSLKESQMPKVDPTIGSPLQYGYRTKLTPHFDGRRNKAPFTQVPNIGFNKKGTRSVLDIESCPIGTDIVQEGLTQERARVVANLSSYKQGATVLIRESTKRVYNNKESPNADQAPETEHPIIPDLKEVIRDARGDAKGFKYNFPEYSDLKTYTANNDDLATEYVNGFAFTNRAGSFFQNNNSILGKFTSYINQFCQPPETADATSPSSAPIKYLLDAYCGSGLFTVTLSKQFKSALGIDVDVRAIEAARENATSNNVHNAGFIDADAADLFADVPFPPDQTLCVIDPPRKGASEDFLRQLCAFGPRRVVYVSCNVHTQARDVGMLVNGFAETKGGETTEQQRTYSRFQVERIQGFDFFPQTGHVESVCVLNRVERQVDWTPTKPSE